MAKKMLTPAMKQFMKIKEKYPDAILLFRMGDFYETFFEDAKTVSRDLNIVLTSRGSDQHGNPVPLAGVPYHSLDAYLSKLVRKGHKVVIVEQVEDPKKAKGLVKRDVVRIVTPGTVIEDSILSERDNNYLMAVTGDSKLEKFGIGVLEVSTGEFLATEVKCTGNRYSELLTEVSRFSPSEIILPSWMFSSASDIIRALKDVVEGCTITEYSNYNFLTDVARSKILTHFDIISLEGLGLDGKNLAIASAGAVLSYVQETQFNDMSFINSLSTYYPEDKMMLDHTTLRNLEITRNIVDNSTKGTLLSVLDKTTTAMGSRLLKRILVAPETDVSVIQKRLDCVETLIKNPLLRSDMIELLKQMSDLERIMSRVSLHSANARDLVALKTSLKLVPDIVQKIKDIQSASGDDKTINHHSFGELRPMGNEEKNNNNSNHKTVMFQEIMSKLLDMGDIIELLDTALTDDPPLTLREGKLIKDGYDSKLDDLKLSIKDARDFINNLEETERHRTGIKNLKVGYNKVFGYYIEVSKSNIDSVPEHYVRKQTLVNAERYITDELKAKEAVVLSAQERINEIEYDLFTQLRSKVAERYADIKRIASGIALLDVMINFASVSESNGYTRPDVDDSDIIHIVDGRHPVVENIVDTPFVPNDTNMNSGKNRIIILTGPNMAGKSTYMRQIALISIMAQLGCFVPAKYAHLGVLDSIYTRVGAHDDLLRGQSTFMVEMVQLANILNNATPKSLVILDEIGRGTSTFDGLSLAWAVVEYLERRRKGSRVIFATHYHHLTELANIYTDVINYQVMVEERGEDIVFVRRIVDGAASKSYGIEVARLAGLPVEVTERAKAILKRIEEENIIETVPGRETAPAVEMVAGRNKGHIKTYTQYVLFPFGRGDSESNSGTSKSLEGSEVIEALQKVDINNITPIDALILLKEIKNKIKK